MSRWRCVRMIFCIGMLVLIDAIPAHAALQGFSADVVMTDKTGRVTGKAYVAKDMARMELPGRVVITRVDKDRSWLFVPQEQAYVEQPIDKNVAVSIPRTPAGEEARTEVGKEEAAGVPAVKYRVACREGGGERIVYRWIADDSAIAVKTAAEDGSWAIEYLHCKPGAVDAALFEIPEARHECVPPDEGGGIPLSWGDQEGQVY